MNKGPIFSLSYVLDAQNRKGDEKIFAFTSLHFTSLHFTFHRQSVP